MPALGAGDTLAVLSAGAYGAVMASSYNTRPPAGELLVIDGACHVLRRQRTVAELLAEESIPDF
jgi:diaminopimelate decarboxylase